MKHQVFLVLNLFFLFDAKNTYKKYVPNTHFDMSHPMIVEIRRSCELLTADKTLMRFFTTMDAFMRVQRARGWETLVAHHADMRFLSFNLIPFLNYYVGPSCFIYDFWIDSDDLYADNAISLYSRASHFSIVEEKVIVISRIISYTDMWNEKFSKTTKIFRMTIYIVRKFVFSC